MSWTRRRFLRTSGVAVAGLSLSSWNAPTLLGQSKTPLTTAGILTLTGANAVTGKLIRDGAQVAARSINDAGGIADRYTIDLQIEDSRTSQTEAVNIANRLASRGDVSFTFGPIITSFGLAVQPILAAANIPQIYLGAPRDFTDLHNLFPLSMRYGSQTSLQSAPLVKWAVEERGQDRIFLTLPNTDRGQAFLDAVRRQLSVLGKGRLVGTEFYPSFNRDFSTIVTKVRNSGANAMIIGTGVPAEVIAAAQEFQRQGIDLDDLGFYTGQTPNGSVQFWEAVSNSGAADGFIHTWLYADPDMPRDFEGAIPSADAATEMERAFRDVLGRPPESGQVESWGWGSIQIIRQAIEHLIDQEGEAAVTSLDPVHELPQMLVETILPGSDASGTGPSFRTPFGEVGFLSCGQFDTRLGIATFRDGGEQHLLTPRGYGDELIGPLCG